jgi:EAL domain-containing protein (putative c-di-GMP-specific phosphodiesterase class I)
MEFMAQLRRLGCRFALDDFGSGLSSFSYLKSLPVDFLKIDGSFIRNLPHNASDRAMVSAIQQVARAVGIQTIAEFIENEETIAVLREIGIDYGQGHAIHVPEPLTRGDLTLVPGIGRIG